MSDSKDVKKAQLRVQCPNLKQQSELIRNSIVDIVKKYAEEAKASVTAKQQVSRLQPDFGMIVAGI